MSPVQRIPVALSYVDASCVVQSWTRLSGADLLQGIMDGSVAPAPIFDVLNMRIDAFGPGWIEFSIVPQPYMLNIAGTLHGGVLATVLDSALTCALVTQLPAGLACATTDFQVRFFRPVRIPSSALVARAEVINAGRTLTTAQATASTTDGKLIAHSTGTLAVGPVAKFLIPR